MAGGEGGWEGGKWKKDDYTRSEGREGYLVRGKTQWFGGGMKGM